MSGAMAEQLAVKPCGNQKVTGSNPVWGVLLNRKFFSI